MPRYSPAALLVLFFAVTFPLWSNAYLSPPDSASYFAVARSAVREGNLDFRDDYEALEFEWYFYYLTSRERISNDWPVGSGVVWLPAYAAAQGVATLADAAGVAGRQFTPEDPPREHLLPAPATVGRYDPNFAPTGQSGIYRLFITLMMGCFSAGALYTGMRIAREYVSEGKALAAALLVLLGTPVGFYTYAFAMMSHINSMLAVGLLFWGWHFTRGRSRTLREWALLGAVAGVVVMIRPQDGAFLSLFLVEMAMTPRSQWPTAKGILAAAGAALLTFSPQMITWWTLYGNPLQLPKIEEMHWFAPRLWDTLFSEYHGLLSWSPVLVLVPFGVAVLWRRDRVLAVAIGVVVLLQLYLNAANEIWWSGGSFGNRRMVNCGVPWLVAIAAALGAIRPFVAAIAAVPLAAWNFLLWAKERAGELSLDHFVPWNRAFFIGVLEMLNPAKTFVALMGDFAGFGWPLRLVVMALGVALAVWLHRRRAESPGPLFWRRTATVSLAWFAAGAPLLFLVLAARTGSHPPESFPKGIARENRSLFNGYYEYGYFNLVKGRWKQARQAYEKAADLVPGHPNPHRYLASLALEEQDWQAAIDHSDRALEINPQYDAALQVQAQAIEQLIIDNPALRIELLHHLAERLRAARREEEAIRIEAMIK